LFEAFPGSAKELPNDEGLFMGPRPSILQDVKPQMLKELVEKIDGVVLLTMSDVRVKELEKIVPKNVVLSIRDSKGLEFADVIIVDFFKDLAPEHQKPWKQLIQGRVEDGMRNGFPELETHLKQVSTALLVC
jgi:superfamily I DNA/RNA helicase